MTRANSVTWLLWILAYTGTTLVMYLVSGLPDIRTSHAILAYLALIILASRHGSRALAMTMVVLGYLAVDWLYIPRRFTLGAAKDLDWFVLGGFAFTGWLISEMFAKQKAATRLAEERTREVERLSAERLQLEREVSTVRVLTEADRLKNALLHSLTHDLRSPIATLSLLADPASGFSGDVALQRVGEEAHRLAAYLATLQRFASDGSGNGLRVERHDVDTIVQTALRSSEALLTGRTVRVEASAQSHEAMCDLTLCVQVLGNLLQNAVRYAPATEPIDMSVRITSDEKPRVAITVADRGPGVKTAEIGRLFSPMRRVRAGGESDGQGTGERMGIGLSIARTFARAQRGDVTYAAREGGGAAFTLLLPLPSCP